MRCRDIEHERGVRVTRGAAKSNSSLLSALQTFQVLNISTYLVCVHVYVTIYFFLTVKLMFLSWNWEKVYSQMIVKSIFRCRKTINSPKNRYWKKTTLQRLICTRHSPHSSRRWQQQQQHSDLFSLLSVNKFKRFLLNFLTKHMVNASLSIAELWMHSGDSGLLSSQQLEELRIVYWRHQRAQ